MARKKGKPVSFDAMVKFFLQYYNIPTKKDVDRMMEHMNRLEQMIKSLTGPAYFRTVSATKGRKSTVTASDTVLDVIKKFNQGVGIAQIQAKTGFDDKKLRNIIYRLNKAGKIRRKSRGVYMVNHLIDRGPTAV